MILAVSAIRHPKSVYLKASPAYETWGTIVFLNSPSGNCAFHRVLEFLVGRGEFFPSFIHVIIGLAPTEATTTHQARKASGLKHFSTIFCIALNTEVSPLLKFQPVISCQHDLHASGTVADLEPQPLEAEALICQNQPHHQQCMALEVGLEGPAARGHDLFTLTIPAPVFFRSFSDTFLRQLSDKAIELFNNLSCRDATAENGPRFRRRTRERLSQPCRPNWLHDPRSQRSTTEIQRRRRKHCRFDQPGQYRSFFGRRPLSMAQQPNET